MVHNEGRQIRRLPIHRMIPRITSRRHLPNPPLGPVDLTITFVIPAFVHQSIKSTHHPVVESDGKPCRSGIT